MCKWSFFPFILSFGLAAACGGNARRSSFQEPQKDAGVTQDAGFGDFFGDGGSENGLIVEPSNAVVFIDTATTPATRAKQAFKVTRKSSEGDKDVTAEATFTLDKPELGGFTANVFESVGSLPPTPPGVTSGITIKVDGGSAIAQITVVPLRRSSDKRDFFFLEPFNEAPTPASDVLRFNTNIQSVDVAFVVDTTGSMGSEINGIRSALGGTLLSQLQAAIPSVGMSIVSHKDETDGSELVRVFQTITPTLSLAQSAAGRLNATGGADTPEGQVPAMFHVLTGLSVAGIPGYLPSPGTIGAVEFRAGSVPVVVLISDAPWHDPRGGISGPQLVGAFLAANARFVALTSDSDPSNETQADALSDATGSHIPPAAFVGCPAGLCCTGVGGATRGPLSPGAQCRLNFKYQKSSPNIGQGVVDAIKAIAIGSTYDVTVRTRNDATNAGGVDATRFIKALRAKDEGDAAQGCPAHAAKDTDGDGVKDTFVAITVTTPVCFEVIPQTNTIVQPEPSAQFFGAFLDVVGVPGDIKLDQRRVLFLVPPKAKVAN